MDPDFNTRKKLQAVLGQISKLLLSDFPHASSEEALKLMQKYFLHQVRRLDAAKKSSIKRATIQTCITINERIYQHLPILGFLLRSTNVRNAFEAYYSLVEIAQALIGSKAKVVVSSEWDFSPLTYPMTVSVLPNYVLLGLPSTESMNSLVLPLAGHELGHSVWLNEDLENQNEIAVNNSAKEYLRNNWQLFQAAVPNFPALSPTDKQFQTNRLLVDLLSDIVTLTLSQMEETFCDALGVHLFGNSYAYAFHYLLAPSLGGTRAIEYPTLAIRAQNIAQSLNLDRIGFKNYPSEFEEKQPSLADRDKFIVDAADAIAIAMSFQMYISAQRIICKRAQRFASDEEAVAEILVMFKHNVPARNPRALSDILNAAWRYVDEKAATHDESKRPLFEWVSELVLKSVEVLEYKTRVDHA
jgi:hypothetical protein